MMKMKNLKNCFLCVLFVGLLLNNNIQADAIGMSQERASQRYNTEEKEMLNQLLHYIVNAMKEQVPEMKYFVEDDIAAVYKILVSNDECMQIIRNFVSMSKKVQADDMKDATLRDLIFKILKLSFAGVAISHIMSMCTHYIGKIKVGGENKDKDLALEYKTIFDFTRTICNLANVTGWAGLLYGMFSYENLMKKTEGQENPEASLEEDKQRLFEIIGEIIQAYLVKKNNNIDKSVNSIPSVNANEKTSVG